LDFILIVNETTRERNKNREKDRERERGIDAIEREEWRIDTKL